MTKEELAARLNGREYRNEISKDDERLARKSGLVVLFGASDDLAEFRGAIEAEVGCFDGGDIYLVDGETFEDEDCQCRHAEAARKRAKEYGHHIYARWCGPDGYSWTYETKIPHSTFDVMEDGEKYCRGIVFEHREVA